MLSSPFKHYWFGLFSLKIAHLLSLALINGWYPECLGDHRQL